VRELPNHWISAFAHRPPASPAAREAVVRDLFDTLRKEPPVELPEHETEQ
jgi:hypothetical protein